MASRGYILTFHSHNIAGGDYATNDHVALDRTLAVLRSLKVPILRLLDVARALRAGTLDGLAPRFACITFDDGSDYDWHDLRHPTHGPQPSMRGILRSHSTRLLGFWLERSCATSFVIASREARQEISAAALGEASLMTDTWWRAAQRSGLIDIGTHGWDHVHPAVARMAGNPLVERFDRVADPGEAQLQVERAAREIRSLAGDGAAQLFAYPYGQVSDFLADNYLPSQSSIVAAVAVKPVPLTAQSDPWRIPRYVCGHDWRSEDDLRALLRS